MDATTAPRVTQEDVTSAIVGETYTVLPDGRTTVCQLMLYNGFTVSGQSACVSQENFDAEVGYRIARTNAVEKVWPLLGFRLAERLYREALPHTVPMEPLLQQPIVLGEQVLFYEQVGDQESPAMLGLVTAVLDNNQVALAVFAPNGTHHVRQKVDIVAGEDRPVSLKFYARRKY